MAPGLVLRGVEDREVPADDLVRRVPLEVPRADVPGEDVAGRIDEEDRVVAHARHEAPELDELSVRGLQLVRPGAHLLLLHPAGGEIAADLAEPDEIARLVVHRGDHDVRPEARAVLADAPSLLLVAPVPDRAPQLLGGMVPRDVRLRVEDGEVPADDLVLRVALDRLRTGVPGHDAAVRIQHEDRVVERARDQQRELPILGHPVARSLHERHRTPVGFTPGAARRGGEA